MSDTDSFIREVTEEVRQDRMLRYWKRYGPYVLGAIAAIIAVAAFFSWREHVAREATFERGALLIEAVDEGEQALEAAAAELQGAAALIPRFRLAQTKAAEGQLAEASTIYRGIAVDPAAAPRYADLALLESLRLDAVEDPAGAIAALDVLVAPGQPYRPLALELRAALRLDAGDVAGAREDMAAVLDDPFATGDTRARVEALQATLPPTE